MNTPRWAVWVSMMSRASVRSRSSAVASRMITAISAACAMGRHVAGESRLGRIVANRTGSAEHQQQANGRGQTGGDRHGSQ